MATTVIVQQPLPTAALAGHSNQWSTGICGCFDDCSVCCYASWCFPCFACTTASDFGECFCLPLMDIVTVLPQLCGICIYPPPASMAMRGAVRNRYGIQGDLMSDCVYATFCNPCSWCQIAREIKRRKTTFSLINTQPTVVTAPQILAPQPAMMVPHQTNMFTGQSTVMTSHIG